MNLPSFSVKNRVSVNLIMVLIIVGGIYYWNVMLREFFPNFSLDQFVITTPLPSTTPEEIEKSVTSKVEREIEAIDGIESIASNVLEGVSIINITLLPDAKSDDVLDELRTKIDIVQAELPEDTEDTIITEVKPTLPVISIVLYGDVSEELLRREAIDIKDDLQSFSQISNVKIAGIRDKEIHIKVYPEKLEEYSLTFEQIGRQVASINLDVPGGQIKKNSNNINVRTIGESKKIKEIEEIVVLTKDDGTIIRLKDIAIVENGYEDKIEKGRFAGKNACMVTVFKAASEDALKIATIVKDYIAKSPTRLSGAISLGIINDLSRFIEQRLDLMLRSATNGFILVLIALIIFLDLRTAFWVAMGLVVSFLGTFVIMDILGITINLISLFALILVLGLVVDDAIIVSENIFTHIREGKKTSEEAAIVGANEVVIPVIAAVSTSIIAFIPLMFLDKEMGGFLGVLPKVMIAALSVSLLEVFLILPAHMVHKEKETVPTNFIVRNWCRMHEVKNNFFEKTLPNFVTSILRTCLYWRYITISVSITFSLMVFGLLAGDIIEFVLLQKVDAEIININLEMASGTSEQLTTDVIKKIEKITLNVPEVEDVFAVIGTAFSDRGVKTPDDPATVGQLTVELITADVRQEQKMRNSQQVIASIRQELGEIPGIKSLAFEEMAGGPQGADVEIRVEGKSFEQIGLAVNYIKNIIYEKKGVLEVNDTLKKGKQELRIRLLDSAYSAGITTSELALQIRHALFGFESQKLQNDDEEIVVRVFLPENDRASIRDLYALKIVTSSGARIPLEELADITTGRGYSSISRYDGKRVVNIKADVDEDIANISKLTSQLEEELNGIEEKFPGISISFEGRRKQTDESIGSLKVGFIAALFAIYIIIATLFNSYTQPIIIMIAIPYAIVGAILGHFIMQMPFTLLSMIGCVALAGVVVNDSLVLVSFVNQIRENIDSLVEVLIVAVHRRIRAILLTTITTVFGLIPLMLEKSFQAQFLIPMAISLVFGLIFATAITLIVIPVLYMILEDIKNMFFGTIRYIIKGWNSD